MAKYIIKLMPHVSAWCDIKNNIHLSAPNKMKKIIDGNCDLENINKGVNEKLIKLEIIEDKAKQIEKPVEEKAEPKKDKVQIEVQCKEPKVEKKESAKKKIKKAKEENKEKVVEENIEIKEEGDEK
jgi:hypothetical protein